MTQTGHSYKNMNQTRTRGIISSIGLDQNNQTTGVAVTSELVICNFLSNNLLWLLPTVFFKNWPKTFFYVHILICRTHSKQSSDDLKEIIQQLQMNKICCCLFEQHMKECSGLMPLGQQRLSVYSNHFWQINLLYSDNTMVKVWFDLGTKTTRPWYRERSWSVLKLLLC